MLAVFSCKRCIIYSYEIVDIPCIGSVRNLWMLWNRFLSTFGVFLSAARSVDALSRLTRAMERSEALRFPSCAVLNKTVAI